MTTRIEEIKKRVDAFKHYSDPVAYDEGMGPDLEFLLDRVEELDKKLTVAVEALEFYADLTIMPNNEAYFFGVRVTEGVNELGHKAREALKKIV